MTENLFLAALQRITAGAFSLGELIDITSKFTAAGQRELARQLYKVWIKVNPQDPLIFVALFNCAEHDDKLGDRSAAIDCLIAAIKAKPDFAPAHINLGGLLERAGAPNFALDQWKAVAHQPMQITGEAVDYAITALKQTARVLNDHKINDGAEAAIVRALDIDRKQPDVIAQHIAIRLGACKWPIMEPVAKLDRKALLESTHPLSMTWYTDDPLLQLATAERYVREQIGDPPKDWDADRRHAPIDLSNRRLRVGYISSDLRDHAIGYLMAELFEVHDKKKVEVFAYYCGMESESGLTNRIKDAVEHWVDITKMNDDEAARRIAADGIDILVDINGHTKDSRTLVFARHAAPIQVNWLGFPGSMGTPYHHYMIADEWIVPPGSEMYYAEKTRASAVLSAERPQTSSRRRQPDARGSGLARRRVRLLLLQRLAEIFEIHDRPFAPDPEGRSERRPLADRCIGRDQKPSVGLCRAERRGAFGVSSSRRSSRTRSIWRGIRWPISSSTRRLTARTRRRRTRSGWACLFSRCQAAASPRASAAASCGRRDCRN